MTDPVLRVVDVPAEPAERAAFEGREPYAPSYLDFEELEERGDPPRRLWAIDGWLGMGHVTLLSAKGGMGKSVLAMQLATALALSLDFVGKIHQPRTSLVWMGEDDDDELWRRQHAICRKFSKPMSALRGRVMLESMATEDCTLVANVHGIGMARTGMLSILRQQIGDLKAEVVVLDNIARLFAGNENDRYEVTAFMAGLAWATAPTGAATLLVGHVSRGAGSEYSGNAAWENAARARLWFTDSPPDKPPSEPNEDGDDDKPDLRYLAKRKVNYTTRDLCVMQYTDDAYSIISAGDPTGIVANIRNKAAEGRVLSAFDKLSNMGLVPTESSSSPNYLPRLIGQYKLADGFTKTELARALRSLMIDGQVSRKQVGQYPNRTPKFGLVTTP
jgi:hypothetical protein